MILSYTLSGQTQDRKKILGNVVIDSTANVPSPGALSFSIIAFQINCDGVTFCGCENAADSINLSAGPPDSGTETVNTSSGSWSMGEWNNGGADATGVWFRNVDGSKYETAENHFGKLDHYKYIGPRIELCTDLVMQGSFQPVGNLLLTWNPQFSLKEHKESIAPVSNLRMA